jgi:adenine-specific DNA-methyltransferase
MEQATTDLRRPKTYGETVTMPDFADSIKFSPINDLTGPGEARDNVALLARLFPDAVADGRVDFEALRGLLGDDAEPTGAETSGLRWVGLAESRQLSTLPATGTLLPRPDESVEWDTTRNVVIEGDNLEVLRLLRRGYTNKVDVIYIDPPYNTGNDFVYDDKRMTSLAEHESAAGLRDDSGATQTGRESDRADERRLASARHAKWLSMMYPRLLAAHSLLSESGVLIAAIDDVEHARLKLLLDRVFGAENFLANIAWQGGVSALAKHTGGGLDYMLVYAKNKDEHVTSVGQWRAKKKGAAEFIEAGRTAWQKAGSDPERATGLFREWARTNRSRFDTSISVYDRIDETGRLFFAGDLANGMLRPNLQYDVLHPISRKPVRMPEKGWRHEPARMNANIEAGLVLFGADESTIPTLKRYLDEYVTQVPSPSLYKDRRGATALLANLIGPNIFDFPKDHTILAEWIEIVTAGKSDAVVLDFFAGSGSTGHAVMELNAADRGERRYILVQLGEAVNKDGYETLADVTRERLRRAGGKIAESLTFETAGIDLGFRSYRLASSNLRPWDGTGELSLLDSVDNLIEGRSTDDLLVETMLRLGIELTTPVETRQVASSTLYSLGGGTLYAFFGEDVTTEQSIKVARALVDWRNELPVESDVTIVVRDTGFTDSSAKLNLEAAVKQAGFTTFRSI